MNSRFAIGQFEPGRGWETGEHSEVVGEPVREEVIEEEIDPVEKGRVGFLLHNLIFNLWQALYLVTRICMAYFALLFAVLLVIAICTGVVRSVPNLYLPRARGQVEGNLLNFATVLICFSIVTPMMATVYLSVLLIPEVFSKDELPSSRAIINFARFGLKAAGETTCKRQTAVAIQFLKVLAFLAVLITSLSLGEASFNGTIEYFVISGSVVGSIMFFTWLPLQVVLLVSKQVRRIVLFPDVGVYRRLEGSKRNNALVSGWWAYIVCSAMVIEAALTLGIVAIVMSKIDSSTGVIVAFMVCVTFGQVFTNYMFFSADQVDPSAIPSPTADTDLIFVVMKNFKRLRIEPVPPRLLPHRICHLVVLGALCLTYMVMSNLYADNLFNDSCKPASTLGMDSQRYPNGSRSPNHYSNAIHSALCHQRWHHGQLNVFDMALLARAAYEDNANQRRDCRAISAVKWLNHVYRFRSNDWEVRSFYNHRSSVKFFEFYSQSRNVTVFAIRGDDPNHAPDVLELLDLYAPAATFQTVSVFVPLFFTLPAEKVANLLYYVSFVDRLFPRPEKAYHEVIEDHIVHQLARNETNLVRENIYLVGHSLGGGLTKIVGTLLNRTAISFNGPGLLYSARRFGIKTASVEDNVVNFVMDNDKFSLLDVLGGTIYRMECQSSNVATCHELPAVLCKVLTECGFGDYNYLC